MKNLILLSTILFSISSVYAEKEDKGRVDNHRWVFNNGCVMTCPGVWVSGTVTGNMTCTDCPPDGSCIGKVTKNSACPATITFREDPRKAAPIKNTPVVAINTPIAAAPIKPANVVAASVAPPVIAPSKVVPAAIGTAVAPIGTTTVTPAAIGNSIALPAAGHNSTQ